MDNIIRYTNKNNILGLNMNIKKIISEEVATMLEASITRAFRKAAEGLHKVQLQQQQLRKAFVAEKDPKKKEQLKQALIKLHTIVQTAEMEFNQVLRSEPAGELQENFKKGDKVKYLGNPGVITNVKDYSGRTYYSVRYSNSWGKNWTKASNILSTDGTVTEATFTPSSGTMSGGTYGLDSRKYQLKKDVKGARIGNFTNVTLPKGTIIYNLPGGIFADHFSLKNKYSSRSSQGPRYFDQPKFKGIMITSMPGTIKDIEKSSKVLESLVTEAKNTIGLAFKEEQDYLDFKEFVAEQPRGAIRKNIGFDSKTKSWNVEMDVKVLDSIYGEGTPSDKKSGWYGGLPDDFESVIIESVNEAKNPFKKGDKIIVTKLQRQGDAKRFKGKKGFVLRDSSDNYVMVKLQGFSSPEIEFHMGEIELAESVNEAKDENYLKTLADSDYFAKGYETLFGLQSSIKRILRDREIRPDENDVLDAINWLKDGLGNGDPRKTSLGKKLLKMKWVTESVNEGKDNLYLQLHKKYADQIKGLKAKKIKKLTDLVSVQRWAMEDEYDNSGFDRKAMSKQFNDERKLFKQYMAGDKTVSLKELDVRKVHGDKRIENPKTGNKVKLRTALKGKKGSKVYQTAKKIYNRLKDGE